MIGLLKPEKMELLLKDCLYYKLYYCSICRHLVKNYNRLTAFMNSYEGTLLAMLYNEMVVQDIEAVKDRCSGMPIAKVATLPKEHEAVELGALLSLIAFQVKFQDNLADESGFWITPYNRFLKAKTGNILAKKSSALKKFNLDLDWVAEKLAELQTFEKAPEKRDLNFFQERWAEIFAHLMGRPFEGKIDPGRQDILRDFFSGLGRIINLLDALADMHLDRRAGQFNLVLATEPDPEPDSEAWLKNRYAHYREVLQKEREGLRPLANRLGLRECRPIVENILGECLDKEMETVFESMVHKKEKNERMLFNCKDF